MLAKKKKFNGIDARTILSMSNVIELQRQLLTTVMENEVSPRLKVQSHQGIPKGEVSLYS